MQPDPALGVLRRPSCGRPSRASRRARAAARRPRRCPRRAPREPGSRASCAAAGRVYSRGVGRWRSGGAASSTVRSQAAACGPALGPAADGAGPEARARRSRASRRRTAAPGVALTAARRRRRRRRTRVHHSEPTGAPPGALVDGVADPAPRAAVRVDRAQVVGLVVARVRDVGKTASVSGGRAAAEPQEERVGGEDRGVTACVPVRALRWSKRNTPELSIQSRPLSRRQRRQIGLVQRAFEVERELDAPRSRRIVAAPSGAAARSSSSAAPQGAAVRVQPGRVDQEGHGLSSQVEAPRRVGERHDRDLRVDAERGRDRAAVGDVDVLGRRARAGRRRRRRRAGPASMRAVPSGWNAISLRSRRRGRARGAARIAVRAARARRASGRKTRAAPRPPTTARRAARGPRATVADVLAAQVVADRAARPAAAAHAPARAVGDHQPELRDVAVAQHQLAVAVAGERHRHREVVGRAGDPLEHHARRSANSSTQ